MSKLMNRSIAIILAFCLTSGSIILAPEIAGPIAPSTAKAAVTKYMRFVKPAKLKVHKKASASSKVVITLKKDKDVIQYGSANSGGWIKICYASGKYGYVRKNTLRKNISKAGLKAAMEKNKNKVIDVARKHGWKLDSAGDIDISKYENIGTMASLWITLSNSKFVYKVYISLTDTCTYPEYSSHIYVSGYERKRFSGHDFNTLVSYLVTHATPRN